MAEAAAAALPAALAGAPPEFTLRIKPGDGIFFGDGKNQSGVTLLHLWNEQRQKSVCCFTPRLTAAAYQEFMAGGLVHLPPPLQGCGIRLKERIGAKLAFHIICPRSILVANLRANKKNI